MRKPSLIVAAMSAALLMSSGAKAATCGNVSFSPASTSFTDWNPIAPAQKTATFTATISAIPSSARTVRIIFLDNEATSPTRFGTAGPQYGITNGATTFSSPSSGTPALANQFSLTSGSVAPSFTIAVPANPGVTDWVGGTAYSEALRYTIQCFNNGGANVATDTLQAGPTISLTIPKLVSITTGSPATINFGSFSVATQTLQVGLKSTSSVNVGVSTSNANKLLLSGAGTPDTINSINYSMTLNGDAIANGSSLTNRPRAGVAGTNWPLVLTLTDGIPSGKLAGTYSDTITLTLTPGL